MPVPSLPTHSLKVREHRGRPFYEIAFRHGGKQIKRRIGPAWLKRSRAPEGYFDEGAAHASAREIVAEHVASTPAPSSSGPTFREIAHAYLEHCETVKGSRPSTLADYRWMLGEPDVQAKRGSRTSNGHVMRALGDRPAAEVTTREVEDMLAAVADSGGSARTCNKYRAVAGAVFNFGVRRYGLPANPAKHADRRRQPQVEALDFYSAAEIEAIAAAAGGQDGELIRVAGFTGLRRGELLALRWSDVGSEVITVSRALSAGIESGTKSGRVRHVPLIPQARAALDRLRSRGDFTADGELVFVNVWGRALDPSSLLVRYRAAQRAAGVRELRLHDLRHSFGSLLAAGGVDPVSIQSAMGHSDLATTQRYLHARQASQQVDRFARAFE